MRKINNVTFEEITFLTSVPYTSKESAEECIKKYSSATKIKYKINGKEVEIYTGMYEGKIYVFDIYTSPYIPEYVLIHPTELDVLKHTNNIEILNVV